MHKDARTCELGKFGPLRVRRTFLVHKNTAVGWNPMKRIIVTISQKMLDKKSKKCLRHSSASITSRSSIDRLQVSDDLDTNVQTLQSSLGLSDDIVFRYFEIASFPSLKATIVFIDNLIDEQILESSVLTPLTQGVRDPSSEEKTDLHASIQNLLQRNLTNTHIQSIQNISIVLEEILKGNGILLIDGYNTAVSISLAKGSPRKSGEASTEKAIKGPQQSFVEDYSINTALIRQKLKTPDLVVKQLQLGKLSKTEIRVVYLQHIADASIVREVFQRLSRIDTDAIKSSAGIEEYITDAPMGLFPTTFYTERPDRLQAMLSEGRIGIICDGTPFCIVVPAIISDFFICADDYYQNPYFSTFNRLLGYAGGLILTFLPAIYIAGTTFHQEMIPTKLALTIAGTRAGVPYPAFVEALLMEFAFEGLREAGTRLPTRAGQAVSIVGALIIGQSAVEAGLVSPAVIIIVATTAIFSFTMPYTNFSLGLRLVRFINMSLAAVLGIYGIMTGGLILLLHLLSLRSFGVPFMIPFAPLSLGDMKDWVLRFPQWAIHIRSPHLVKNNMTKQKKV